jgi:hypothetical protein
MLLRAAWRGAALSSMNQPTRPAYRAAPGLVFVADKNH